MQRWDYDTIACVAQTINLLYLPDRSSSLDAKALRST